MRISEIQGELQRRSDTTGDVYRLFPDSGRLNRHEYKKQMLFFALGAEHSERVFLAANRVGKSVTAAYEVACHALGWYPHWWTGWRVTKPISAILAGDTSATTRDIIQQDMLGPNYDKPGHGGMLPADSIVGLSRRAGTPEAYESIRVKSNYGVSRLKLRSYDQGRKIYQGTEEDIIWLDEEAPSDVIEEGTVRLMTTGGRMLLTYTAVNGYTQFTTDVLENHAVMV